MNIVFHYVTNVLFLSVETAYNKEGSEGLISVTLIILTFTVPNHRNQYLSYLVILDPKLWL